MTTKQTTSSRKTSKPTSKAGRPRLELDLTQVEALAQIGCTIDEIATVLGVGPSTVDDRMAKDIDFQVAYKRGREHGKATLRRMQWNSAKGGHVTMMIWLGKQLLGQKDHRSVNLSVEGHALKLAEQIKEKDPNLYEKVVKIMNEMEDE